MSSHVMARMAVEIEGDGEPVLMVHGLGGTSNTFQPQMAVLSGFRVIRPDLPGSGRSSVPDTLSVGAMVAGLVALCAAAGVASAHVVGHSLGTIVAQHLAVEHPGSCARCACWGRCRAAGAAREAQRKRAADARAQGMAEIAQAVSQGSLSAETRRDNLPAVAFVRESLMRQPPAGYALTCEALADAHAADAGAIRVPTLLLTGADDPVAPPSVARQLGERIAGAVRWRSCRDAGIGPSVERAAEVNRRLAGFLSQRQR